MCEFCEGNNILAEEETSLGKRGKLTTELELSTDGDDYFLGAYSSFEGIDKSFGCCVVIKYCPMCGRNLTEEPT